MTARKKTPSAKPVPAKKPVVARKTKKPTTKVKAAAPAPKVAGASAKVAKSKKVKLIRDSFTMPSFDYDLIAALKVKALNSKAMLKKSELLRAGLHALNKLDAKQLIALVGTLAVVKTGRPKK
jgi:hypothetical protein